jgi:hypothetical protein
MNSKLKNNNEDVQFIKRFYQHFVFYNGSSRGRTRPGGVFFFLDLRCEDLYPDPYQKAHENIVSRYK